MHIGVNSNGVNKLIKATILSDEEMKRIGFNKNYYEGTDHEEYSPYWYFLRWIQFPKENKYKNWEISFSVSIPKDGSDIRIDVLDEDFGQPYDYQSMLRKNPNSEPCLIIKEQVEEYMKYLQDNGVLNGHKYGEYI